MFLLAAAGELSFNDPAYRILRAKANNLLHHASDVNCGKVLAVLLYCSMTKRTNWPSGADAGRDFAGLLDRMDDAQKAAKYRAIEQALMLEVGRYVLCWTPVIGCVAALVVVLIPAAIANRELTRIANGKGVQAFAQSSLLRGELDADETLCAAA
ncbi:MAG: hypothetical protein K2X42_07200 [Burkholderiaceae bacterium]|nr:hypothetical protein [Burkholderiaceae bacterium]